MSVQPASASFSASLAAPSPTSAHTSLVLTLLSQQARSAMADDSATAAAAAAGKAHKRAGSELSAGTSDDPQPAAKRVNSDDGAAAAAGEGKKEAEPSSELQSTAGAGREKASDEQSGPLPMLLSGLAEETAAATAEDAKGRKGKGKGKKEKKDSSYNRKEKSLGLLCEKSSTQALAQQATAELCAPHCPRTAMLLHLTAALSLCLFVCVVRWQLPARLREWRAAECVVGFGGQGAEGGTTSHLRYRQHTGGGGSGEQIGQEHVQMVAARRQRSTAAHSASRRLEAANAASPSVSVCCAAGMARLCWQSASGS